MAANIFQSVPVPAGDGTGGTVPVAGQGLKTVFVGGAFDATVTIEGGVLGRFAPIFEFTSLGQKGFREALDEIRVRVSNFRSGVPIVFVAGEAGTTSFAVLDVPVVPVAGGGTGAALDTSTFGQIKSFIVNGAFDAQVIFEASADAAGPFVPVKQFDRPNNIKVDDLVSRFIRIRIENFRSGLALAAIAANDPEVGDVPQSRTLTAGTGMTGGGDLSADRTFNVNADDPTIVVDGNGVRVGVIQDANHGNLGGAALHALAVAAGDAGFMSGADKSKLDSIGPPDSASAEGGANGPTSTNAAFVLIPDMTVSLTTAGGNVALLFTGSFDQRDLDDVDFQFFQDGAPVGEIFSYVIANGGLLSQIQSQSLFHLVTGLAAGTYLFETRWRVNAGTARAIADSRATVALEIL